MSLSLNTERMQARVDNGVGWMIFNNPARHNALSLEMWQGIGDILEYYSSSDDVRVVVMRGAGGKASGHHTKKSYSDPPRHDLHRNRILYTTPMFMSL